jgi:hypothetical protein
MGSRCYPDAARVIGRLAVWGSMLLPGALSGQTCREPHYRWSEKIDTTLATHRAAPTDVTTILSSWAPPSLARGDMCAPRAGREDSVFVLTAWVRRIQLHESDGDWHIELTAAASDPVSACVIVEIPAERYGAVYRAARAALAALVDTTGLGMRGDVASPVQVRFTGAAFFDGYHQVPLPGGTPRPVLHGRCNASLRALWELHPVYKVESPGR